MLARYAAGYSGRSPAARAANGADLVLHRDGGEGRLRIFVERPSAGPSESLAMSPEKEQQNRRPAWRPSIDHIDRSAWRLSRRTAEWY